MPQGGMMQGQMYGSPAGAAPMYGSPAGAAPVYQVYTVPAPKKPEVTYPTKKVSNKVIVGLVVGTLMLCFGIMTALTVHHMATDGLRTEARYEAAESDDDALCP